MGTWMYVAAAAAKKRRDDEARNRRRARKAQEAMEEEIDSEEYQEEEIDNRRYNIDDLFAYILQEISYPNNNAELLEFVEKFCEYGHKIDMHDSLELSAKGTSLTEELRQKAIELEKSRKKLEQSDITLEDNHYNAHIVLNEFYPVKRNGQELLGYSCGDGTTDKDRIYKHYYFNGLKLTEKILKDPNYDEFDSEYEKLKSWYKDSLSKEDELLKKLNRNKTLLKFSIFHRYEREQENEKIEQELNHIQHCKDKIEAARVEAETFKNLTPEQKEAILEYIQTRKQCEDLEHKIEEKVCEEMYAIFPSIHRVSEYQLERSDKSRDKWNRALKLMIEEGTITRESLLEVVKMFATVQRKQQEDEYDDRIDHWYAPGDIKHETYKRAIKWFVKNIYTTQNEKEKPDEEIVK